MTAAKVSRPPARAALVRLIRTALDDMKAVNVKVLDVRRVTDVADCMVVASGNSDRHVRSIADRVVEEAKAGGFRPLGMEGQRDAEWVLVDLNDVIVHVMLPRVREFYGLESLWEAAPAPVRKPAAGRPAARGKPAVKGRAAAKGKAASAARKKPAAPARRKPAARPGSASRGGARAKSGKARS